MGSLALRRCSPARSGAQASSARDRHRGFTLVEILVAVTVIAIASSIAVVAWRGDPRVDANREAHRFAGALEYATQRAQWRRETLAVETDGRGWRFLRRDDRAQWTAIVDDDVLAARTLPAPLTIAALQYAGQPVAAGTLIPLHASGRNDPSAFVIDGGSARVVVVADPLNRVTVAAAP
ncbi:MAG: type II secretion system protein [Casimicrobiaceae bacterium]